MIGNCKDCLWWIGWAGKGGDFGYYAPCVCDESPSRMKVTTMSHGCRSFQARETPQAAALKVLKALDYDYVHLWPSQDIGTTPTDGLQVADDDGEGSLCSDCPPPNYPTHKTRCGPCPRRNLPLAKDGQP